MEMWNHWEIRLRVLHGLNSKEDECKDVSHRLALSNVNYLVVEWVLEHLHEVKDDVLVYASQILVSIVIGDQQIQDFEHHRLFLFNIFLEPRFRLDGDPLPGTGCDLNFIILFYFHFNSSYYPYKVIKFKRYAMSKNASL